MNSFDFYCVEAGSGSIKSLMKVPGVKRSDIKTHVYYTNNRFPAKSYTVSVGFMSVMGIGHIEARKRVDGLVAGLPTIPGVKYHTRFFPVD